MNGQRIAKGIMLLVLLSGTALAQPTTDATTSIKNALCGLYRDVNMLLGAVVFLLIVLAAVVYAAGQVMGAETRARASVWATSMIVGAIIGIIIYVLVPPILSSMGGLGDIESVCGPI